MNKTLRGSANKTSEQRFKRRHRRRAARVGERMIIQIYSMTSIADAIATAEAGADLVGVVVAEPGVVAEGIEAAAARDILAAVRPRETIAEADAHQEAADYLMLDSGAKGATGETHDWSVARAVVERSRVPVILAGGLSADNVARAIATVRPWGVDSFTHPDVPGNRGKKNAARVRAFIGAALHGFADAIAS